MIDQQPTFITHPELCPFCYRPTRPDPERPGCLWCDTCQEAVNYAPPAELSALFVPATIAVQSPALAALRFWLMYGQEATEAFVRRWKDGTIRLDGTD